MWAKKAEKGAGDDVDMGVSQKEKEVDWLLGGGRRKKSGE